MNPIIDIRDNEKLCFAEKTKSIILQKSGGAMAPLAPPVSTALMEILKIFDQVGVYALPPFTEEILCSTILSN